jgi:hypothetical protein
LRAAKPLSFFKHVVDSTRNSTPATDRPQDRSQKYEGRSKKPDRGQLHLRRDRGLPAELVPPLGLYR